MKPYYPESAALSSETAGSHLEFPSEPFPCPACGQMLGPSCRVCVACKQPIDPAQIKRPEPPATPSFEPPGPTVQVSPARFSWPIFLAVVLGWFLLAGLAEKFLGPLRGQVLLGSVVLLSSAWVFYDAHNRFVPKPLRWGLGSLLLWIVVFPWYLARRRDPVASCRFVEGEIRPLTRLLLVVLIIVLLLGLVVMVLEQLGTAH